MADLVEFLNARLDEDKQRGQGDADCSNIDAVAEYGARMVRNVERDRRIIALHSDPRGGDPSCSSLDYPESAKDCETLRLLALPYADHPSFREEWRV